MAKIYPIPVIPPTVPSAKGNGTCILSDKNLKVKKEKCNYK